jgi:HD-like signal output (HDOD) protein
MGEALQRLMRPFASEWNSRFVSNGAEALERLGAHQTDALVTGLALEGMPAIELLRQTTERFAGVARVMLAPPAQHRLVIECASFAHQYVAHPCEGARLCECLVRACDVEASLRQERVGRLVARMDHIPSLPDVYLQLVEKIQDPECSVDDVGAIIARDISMTAQILRLVNSAYFGLRRRVSNPQEAVKYVGIDTVRSLVLSISAYAQFQRLPLGGVVLEKLWNHSLITAGGARAIALREQADSWTVDEAFVSGVLHDLGKLALGANFPADYAQVVADVAGTGDRLAAETREFGADHAEIGGHLLALWGLPGPVVDAVTWHHHPLGCREMKPGPLAYVHAANVWASGDREPAPRIVADYFEKLGLTDRLEDWNRTFLELAGTPARV